MTGRAQDHHKVLQIVLIVNVFDSVEEDDDVVVDFYLSDNLQKCNESVGVCNLKILLMLNSCKLLEFIVRLKQ